ncbi:hypothetical protein EMIHUDRAFT_194627 [Emiliania huxleyi CCMP1516]|uniref:Mitochondrial carrier protein n=2 Tax=Emiliania huxleyi TaxID=2903 RepID=A0A0D3L1U5_EMIH1|nr:hypothetical protein EMIHUDRAFT_194627 [Emiliania huxleyi CCMP1516]EOD41980.1 hypothetical protein EMIHUDRAFT_194627 [Emiliania huxleyi CCMP1516]|eukprot:XP_005794409.1 hypothetical protein EMIHUDRAFT_194627 [Emiliania huxleyi CCMP1516]
MADNVDDFVAGWVSGAVATLATQPFDMAVTRMQATTHQPGPTLASLRSLMRLDGASLGAAWRGVGPLLLGTPFNNALIFVGYGSGKRFSETGDETPNSLLPVFIGGCVGGFAQSFLASPVELIKGLAATIARDVVPHGVWFASYEVANPATPAQALAPSLARRHRLPPPLALRQLWREGGVAAMYSGFGLKMCRAVYEHVYATCRRLRGADGE